MNSPQTPSFETVRLLADGPVARLSFNRPDNANAFDRRMWEELPRALEWIGTQRHLRVVVLSGEGRHFTGGIDLSVVSWLMELTADPQRATRGREDVLAFIEKAQHAFNALERCPVPVIAAIHGACVGAGVDLIAACDLRLCSADAKFCVKEVDLAVVPDVGTLQRLSHVIGYSATAELTYSAETFDARRALDLRLVSRVLDNKGALLESANRLAQDIASKPPTAVRGIKRNLLWSRDHSVQDGLAFVATWNAAMLVGEDLAEAVEAAKQKRKAIFPD
ncbi:enoyl-CoA hydratase-related protein [Panacagrimonas sp.]|uniref:enoyl-CoA hydratase-related protein n=1 Tax=Panacagrimonas sp. TaxID=2480088 RepID=UPI003B521588